MELWGIYNDYEVSSLGRIRYQSKIIEQLLTRQGYSYIIINDQREFVHRLIEKVFIPNPENKPQVDHINHIRNDNRLHLIPEGTEDISGAIGKIVFMEFLQQ